MEIEELQSKMEQLQCSFCSDNIQSTETSVKLTKVIARWFFELTQIEIRKCQPEKQEICLDCSRDLKFCIEFRNRMIDKQKKLQFHEVFNQKEADTSIDDDLHEGSNNPLGEDLPVKIECIDVTCEPLAEDCTGELTRTETELIETLTECPHCFELVESSQITRHITDNHLEHSSRLQCDKCSFTTVRLDRLEKHYKKFHQMEVPKTDQKRNTRPDSKTRKQCPACGIFVKNLSEHQKMVHIQVKRFLCDFCNYSCYFKTKITRHIQRHIPKHLREQFPCDIPDCDFFATRKDALKSHMLTMHQTVREKICLCIECGKSFYNKSQLNIHIKAVHEKIKNHLCNLCGKSFFNVKDMEMHVKRHGVKDMACEICGNLFYCSLDLRRHLKIHSEPTITCDVAGCNKRFYTNSKLKIHVKIRHEGAKDYFCDYCSSRFSQYNNLKRHVNSVHKSLRINCLIPGCNYSVARKDKYKNHLASQHKFLDDSTKESILKTVKFE